ncbi:hypothetical protein LUW75_09255 [Streptomyces sp. MRC013]|uniref:hypothetical protein n=1 Tax=Streptomyces sp. MRC013 TaxID=2898276 RepID=UPI0020261FB4|nr:hypothetical protein [Streptomyces sp. MRC013]URM90142.1 hypothetical protein LUW75_09255 [Streptomyces sp. MRC013]
MRWDRPAAGREPAAAALLGWLADPKAPRLCLVTGGSGCGKSALLAWLVHHGTQKDAPAERTVHAVVPFAGESMLGTLWSLADQLGVVAGSVVELVGAIENDTRRTVVVLSDLHSGNVAELVPALLQLPQVRLIVETRTASPAHRLLSGLHCAEMDLDLDHWRDQERYELWRASVSDTLATAAVHRGGTMNLSDPVSVCQADPWEVTAAYERDDDEHGGLRRAWLMVGQSLCHERSAPERALLLLTALGDSADPRLTPVLAEFASGSSWYLEWSRVRGDVAPPWPGPVVTLATGVGPLAGCLVVADHRYLRIVRTTDGTPQGRSVLRAGLPRSVAVLDDGTLLVLDEAGRLFFESNWATRPPKTGLESLIYDGPSEMDLFLASLENHSGTALCTLGGPTTGSVIIGDSTGTVRTFGDVVRAEVLHDGAVTAVAGLHLPLDDEETVPLIYSGGTDGMVRAWALGHSPMAGPLVQRPCPVVSLDVAVTATGPSLVVAWRDGVVEWITGETGARQTLRPGRPVRAVAVTEDSRVFVGTDEALTCVMSRRSAPPHQGRMT